MRVDGWDGDDYAPQIAVAGRTSQAVALSVMNRLACKPSAAVGLNQHQACLSMPVDRCGERVTIHRFTIREGSAMKVETDNRPRLSSLEDASDQLYLLW